MRVHGNLSKWNDDRGFGFITSAHGSDELFVHISAFPRDGIRPCIGELVSFEVEAGNDGKRRAVRVQRPGSRATAHRARGRDASNARRSPIAALIGLLAVAAIGMYAYTTITSRHSAAQADFAAQPTPSARPAPVQAFKCDGRTHCSQMTSCAEATYFIQHCPNTQMDGNNDGEPCEQQCDSVDGF